jgi:serine/threonine protein kinase
MAEVFLGSYKNADGGNSDVAIKVPLPTLPQNVLDLFIREAEVASRVTDTQVVRVVYPGEKPAFIAFEYVEGNTFNREIAQRRLNTQYASDRELVADVLQLVRGMKAINVEVIHRDLKPDNIFLTDGVYKISDFGISRYVDEITRSNTFKGWGTAAYMAPEAFRSESVDWRSDQYSLGIVFYEMAGL